MILMHNLPPLVGAVALAAVFSAEVSAADASLFMLTTSLAQDLYKRFVNRAADDERVLAVARWATLGSGTLGVALATVSDDISRTLSIPYTLIGVSLFVPIVAGLYVRRTSTGGALLSIKRRRQRDAADAGGDQRRRLGHSDTGAGGPDGGHRVAFL